MREELDRKLIEIITHEVNIGMRESSYAELGSMVGASKYVVRRALCRLRSANLISAGRVGCRRKTTILRPWPDHVDYSPHNIEPGDVFGRVTRPATCLGR